MGEMHESLIRDRIVVRKIKRGEIRETGEIVVRERLITRPRVEVGAGVDLRGKIMSQGYDWVGSTLVLSTRGTSGASTLGRSDVTVDMML